MKFIRIHSNNFLIENTNYSFNPNKIDRYVIMNMIESGKTFVVCKPPIAGNSCPQIKQIDGSFKTYGSADMLVDANYKLQENEYLKTIYPRTKTN